MVKTKYWIKHTKTNRSRKNGEKNGKALHILMSKVKYGKTIENLRIRIDAKLVINKSDYLKCTSKPNNMLPKMFWNNIVAKSCVKT